MTLVMTRHHSLGLSSYRLGCYTSYGIDPPIAFLPSTLRPDPTRPVSRLRPSTAHSAQIFVPYFPVSDRPLPRKKARRTQPTQQEPCEAYRHGWGLRHR